MKYFNNKNYVLSCYLTDELLIMFQLIISYTVNRHFELDVLDSDVSKWPF